MIMQEINKLFLPKQQFTSLIRNQYYNRLKSQLDLWYNDPPATDPIIKSTIDLFWERHLYYPFDTDCYYAVADCLRHVFLEGLLDNRIDSNLCNNLIKRWYAHRHEIIDITKIQMNCILSAFSRKMFDYFISRYYFLEEIPFNPKIEKKIAYVFAGKGKLKGLYNCNSFPCPTISPEAYFYYGKHVDFHFIGQIGIHKMMFEHPDSLLKFYTLHRKSLRKHAFLVLISLFFILLILAYLSLNNIIPL